MNIPEQAVATRRRAGARRRRPWLLIPAAVIWILATHHQPMLSTAILSAVAFALVIYAMPYTNEVDR